MKSVVIHGVLALAGLVFAYNTWTSKAELEVELGDVSVLECKPKLIESVKLEEKEHEVQVTMRKISGERVAWVKDVRKPAKGKKKSQEFAGGKAIDEYFDKIAPLRALRALGEVGKEQIKEFELDKPAMHLSIKCGSKSSKFAFGGTAYGSGDRYMKSTKSKTVYLVSADVLRDLQSAEFRLMQRDFHRFETTEVETLTVEAEGKRKILQQHDRLDPKKAEWVDASAPDRRNELYGNWLDRVSRLRAQTYLKPKQKPGDDLKSNESLSPVPVLKLLYSSKAGRTLGNLELVKVESENTEYYARSERTHAWVKVPSSVSTQVEDDMRAVLGLPALKRPKKPAASSAAPTPGAAPGPGAAPAAPTPGSKPGAAPAAPSPKPAKK